MAERVTRPKRDIPVAVKAAVLADAQCRYCGDLLAELEVDHTVPLARGGTNDPSNLAAVCVACNTQKRSMLEYEWRAYRVTHGMGWPPLASHPTAPEHYKDRHRCKRHPDAAGSRFGEMWRIFIPYAMHINSEGTGYRNAYACEFGCSWNVWYRIQLGWFSDCTCGYCTYKRALDGMGECWVEKLPADFLGWHA